MTEFAKKTKTELTKILAEKRQGLHTFRFTLAGGKAKNVKEGKGLRKDIARILTAMRTAK